MGMGSGYTGGKADEVVMRIVDGMMAFPGLLLALLILSTLGAADAPWGWLDQYWEAVLIVATVGAVFMPGVARVMRSVTLKAKNQEFVMSARLRGESAAYIIFREVLPNAMTGPCRGVLGAAELLDTHRILPGIPGPWRPTAVAGLGPDDR